MPVRVRSLVAHERAALRARLRSLCNLIHAVMLAVGEALRRHEPSGSSRLAGTALATIPGMDRDAVDRLFKMTKQYLASPYEDPRSSIAPRGAAKGQLSL